jgi:hypothetical protein
MLRVLILLVRFTLSAWVGAATLFVVIAVREVTEPTFDSTIRRQLALLRFPRYYLFGFVLVGVACAGLAMLAAGEPLRRRRWCIAGGLATASLLLLGADFYWVYLPLEAMLSSPEGVLPSDFVALHRTSEIVNTLHVGLACAAALIVNWPRPSGGPCAVSEVPRAG